MLPSSCSLHYIRKKRVNKMSITSYNHKTARFTFKPEPDMQYYKLKDLAEYKDKIYPLRALYINTKSRYGHTPVAATDLFYVNLPAHLLNDVKNIIQDQNTVNDINAGKCGFKVRVYTNKNGSDSYSVEWVDIEPAKP